MKGFTLIELLVVVLIIGILAAVALPQYQVAVKKVRMNNYLLVFRKVKESMARYLLASGGQFPDTLNDLDIDMPGCTVQLTGDGSDYKCNGFSLHDWGPKLVHLDIRIPSSKSLVFYTHSADPAQKIQCRGTSDVDKKVCQSLGGKFVEDVGSESRYEMP